jgi:hypothetical protein
VSDFLTVGFFDIGKKHAQIACLITGINARNPTMSVIKPGVISKIAQKRSMSASMLSSVGTT